MSGLNAQEVKDLSKVINAFKLLALIDEDAGNALGINDGTLEKYLIGELEAATIDENHPLTESVTWAIEKASAYHWNAESITMGLMIGFVRGIGYANRENGVAAENPIATALKQAIKE